ncbi:MAG: hypothetical protein ABI398_02235 [Devosia sp.]
MDKQADAARDAWTEGPNGLQTGLVFVELLVPPIIATRLIRQQCSRDKTIPSFVLAMFSDLRTTKQIH